MEVEEVLFGFATIISLLIQIAVYSAMQMVATYLVAGTRRVDVKGYMWVSAIPVLGIAAIVALLAMPHKEVLERLETLEAADKG